MTTPTLNSVQQTTVNGRRRLLLEIDLPDEIDNLRQYELQARDLTNVIGQHLMEIGLAAMDTQGEPLKLGRRVYTSKGRSANTYHTSFGNVTLDRHTYQNSAGGVIEVPLDLRGRIIANSTPVYASNLAADLAELPVSHVVRRQAEQQRLEVCVNFVQRVVAEVGKIAQSKEQHWQYAPMPEASQVHSISLGYDGAQTPIRHEKQWREAMVGSIAFYDKGGNCLDTILVGKSPERGKEAFFTHMDREVALVKKLYPLASWIGLSDGAKDLRPELAKHCPRLGLDFHHAAEYVSQAAEAMVAPEGRGTWLEATLHNLKHCKNAAADLLLDMKLMVTPEGSKGRDTEAQKNLRAAVCYFEGNLDRMNYWELLKDGLPIGSGVTEAACKTLVKARFCCCGASWHIETMGPLLSLRSLRLSSNRWEQFWRRIERFGY
jgi:hypothetical protein